MSEVTDWCLERLIPTNIILEIINHTYEDIREIIRMNGKANKKRLIEMLNILKFLVRRKLLVGGKN